MDLTILIFLSSGLFLGWSLGSNDAANIFGTAVGSRMVQFITAAVICAVFVVLGAVISGAGAAHGLGKLGSVNALPGAFMVALAAAVTVYAMTKAGLPVSTTQAIVGAIVGWNLFGGFVTDMNTLAKIVGTWVACPILGVIFAAIMYQLVVKLLAWAKLHMVRLDAYTRVALILAGAFGAYSLGANNIANVMGVFVSSSPFEDVNVGGLFTLSSIQQLFLMGGIAIAVGVFYSKRVMMTVGTSIMPVTPVGAWVVVMAQSLVLFIFSSIALQQFIVGLGLPPYPLIPVSSSQAVVGAVIGVGLTHGLRGVRQIRWSVLLNIASGWVSTPIISAAICFFFLFFLQNVFQQQVYHKVYYKLSTPVLQRLEQAGIPTGALGDLKGKTVAKAVVFRDGLRRQATLTEEQEAFVIASAEIYRTRIDPDKIDELDASYLNPDQLAAIRRLAGRSFLHRWQLQEALARQTEAWRFKEKNTMNKLYNKNLRERLDYVVRTFHIVGD